MATPMDTSAAGARRADAPDRDTVLDRYYAGEAVPCPIGCGSDAEVVRVSTTEEGKGLLWTECGGCAQRLRYEVPAATAAERRAVGRMTASAREPTCPRHFGRVDLTRRGRQLICPRCGVRYREG